ncbi:hypothetical protein X975_20887, partial [Stegodyphus mimosarum]
NQDLLNSLHIYPIKFPPKGYTNIFLTAQLPKNTSLSVSFPTM